LCSIQFKDKDLTLLYTESLPFTVHASTFIPVGRHPDHTMAPFAAGVKNKDLFPILLSDCKVKNKDLTPFTHGHDLNTPHHPYAGAYPFRRWQFSFSLIDGWGEECPLIP
jgi:hypothetical protein